MSFEGVDGSGKSTQADLLAEWLRGQRRTVLLTREPGGTPLGERVRRLLLEGDEMGAWAEAALFAAARAEHVERAIRPALERGDDVVCDRYLDSSVAYQGIARGLGEERVRALSLIVTGGLLPDRTFLLLVDPRLARERSAGERDRIEREADLFMERVDEAYRSVASHEPERIVAVDGDQGPAEIAEVVREHIRALL